MALPLTAAAGAVKRFESDNYVEGFATTFGIPYMIWEFDGVKYMEMIDCGALNEADMSDVIMQYDHMGMVFARNQMGQGKKSTLLIEPQERGLFVAADLSLTDESRRMFDAIDKGLIYKMSWAFTVREDTYDKDTHTRTIMKIRKVYDVSAVSYPANVDTDIAARSWIDGVIDAERREALARRAQILKIKLMLEVRK